MELSQIMADELARVATRSPEPSTPSVILSTGLLCTRIQLQPLGSDTLRAVEAVAGMTIG